MINGQKHVQYFMGLFDEEGNQFVHVDSETGMNKAVVFGSHPIPDGARKLVLNA